MENRGAAFQCHLHFQGSVNRPSPKLVWFVSRQRECKKEESREGRSALWMEGGTSGGAKILGWGEDQKKVKLI